MLVKYPPTKVLLGDDRDLLWRFRYHLARDKKALTKFLKAVDWAESDQVKQAIALLPIWEPSDIDDALELLSSQFSEPAVRRYAVSRLERAGDDELTSYLLQLVQAIKFEGIILDANAPTIEDSLAAAVGASPNGRADLGSEYQHGRSRGLTESADANDARFSAHSVVNQSALVRFLISRAVENQELTVFLFW